MVELIRRQRKSAVLTPSSIPCLNQVATINISEGCSLGCVYCYIQGYSHYPGQQRVVLFDNTPEMVARELSRKRKKPRRVYFSPSSDAFQYLPEVQEISFKTMQVLLNSGVEISFLTKGFVTEQFVELFRSHADRVYAQVGITSLDRELWRHFEPRTAPPEQRLDAMHQLVGIGVHTTARLDPLIPDVTDTADNLTPLFEALSRIGIKRAAASFLFLRPGFVSETTKRLANFNKPTSHAGWRYHHFLKGCGGGKVIDAQERYKRFENMRELGRKYGIEVNVCRCKNPDLPSQGCQIAGPILDLAVEPSPTLFNSNTSLT